MKKKEFSIENLRYSVSEDQLNQLLVLVLLTTEFRVEARQCYGERLPAAQRRPEVA